MNKNPHWNEHVAAPQDLPLSAAGALPRVDAEGGKRADGAERGRQMQANPGHWRSLEDSRKPIVSRGDSR